MLEKKPQKPKTLPSKTHGGMTGTVAEGIGTNEVPEL